jgi:hypothetical protein
MPKKTRLFICYKKKGPDGADNSAYQLGKFLGKVSNYDVWMDEVMQPGIEWEKTIYEKLLSTDVVISWSGQWNVSIGVGKARALARNGLWYSDCAGWPRH